MTERDPRMEPRYARALASPCGMRPREVDGRLSWDEKVGDVGVKFTLLVLQDGERMPDCWHVTASVPVALPRLTTTQRAEIRERIDAMLEPVGDPQGKVWHADGIACLYAQRSLSNEERSA